MVSKGTKRKVAVEVPASESESDDGEEAAFEKTIEAHAKRQRVVKGLEEEYVCPIAQELFIDPVTAEDGRVYERAKIARWST
ncbi:MAG: U-box domain-containing protein [Paracoccaceae bacterium]